MRQVLCSQAEQVEDEVSKTIAIPYFEPQGENLRFMEYLMQ